MVTPAIQRSVNAQGTKVLTTGSRYDRFDQIRQRHFWSSQLFTTDANGYIPQGEFDVFTTPQGQFGQGYPVGLTAKETNWNSANRVPDNQNFDIKEIGVTLHPVVSSVDAEQVGVNQLPHGVILNTFLTNLVVAVRYLTNSVELGLASDFAQASGPTMGVYQPYISGEGDGYVTSEYALNGFAGPGLRRRFKIPLMLQHGESFAFQFKILRSFWAQDLAVEARLDFWATESFVEKS
jgi:hypothetical protein